MSFEDFGSMKKKKKKIQITRKSWHVYRAST